MNLRSISDGSLFVLDPRSDPFIREEAGLYRFEFHVAAPTTKVAKVSRCLLIKEWRLWLAVGVSSLRGG